MCNQSLCKIWIYKGMKTVGVTDYTNQTPLRILDWKMSTFNTRKIWENIYQMCTKWEVHIFNVWTIIMERLNIKEWKLLELQFTQTRHPLRISDRKMSKKNEKIFIKCAQNRWYASSICEQLLCKVWIKKNENFWSYRLHKLGTPKCCGWTDGWTDATLCGLLSLKRRR